MPLTLQVNLAPPDAAYAHLVLPHQLRAWSEQVDEIVLTLDLRRPTGDQFGARWKSHLPEIRAVLARAQHEFPKARVAEVDYSRPSRAAVADSFFGDRRVPIKDFRGGPYFSYFYGLREASHRYILHLDSDMMFGGFSQTWLTEAVAALAQSPDVLMVNPFPGPPPVPDAASEAVDRAERRVGDYAYTFATVSTRLFLVDRDRLVQRLCPLAPERVPGWRMMLGTLRARRTPHALPEDVLSRAMNRAGMHRLDILGNAPGMWAIHPVVRDEAYFRALPELIARIERGAVTQAQIGRYNLDATMLA